MSGLALGTPRTHGDATFALTQGPHFLRQAARRLDSKHVDSVEVVGEPRVLVTCGEAAQDVRVHPVVGGDTPELELVPLDAAELAAWGG